MLILSEFAVKEEEKLILMVDVKAFSDSTSFGIERKQAMSNISNSIDDIVM